MSGSDGLLERERESAAASCIQLGLVLGARFSVRVTVLGLGLGLVGLVCGRLLLPQPLVLRVDGRRKGRAL